MGFSHCSGKAATFCQDEPRDRLATVLWLWTSMEPWLSHQLWIWGTPQPVLLRSLLCYLLVWIFLEKCSCWLSTMQPVLLPCFSFKRLLPLAAISFWSSLFSPCGDFYVWGIITAKDFTVQLSPQCTILSIWQVVGLFTHAKLWITHYSYLMHM